MNKWRPSQRYLKKILSYDSKTGVFIWKYSPRDGWAGKIAGHISDEGYCVIGFNKKVFKASRLAWLYAKGKWPEHEIDHINGIRTDNRIENLRVATRSKNMANCAPHRDSLSGLKGVCWEKHIQKWSARIGVNGKKIYLGLFADAKEAAYARDKASVLYFGKFARLNFPEEFQQ